MVPEYRKNRKMCRQAPEMPRNRLGGHGAFPRVAVDVIAQEENGVRGFFEYRVYNFFGTRIVVRREMEIPGDKDFGALPASAPSIEHDPFPRHAQAVRFDKKRPKQTGKREQGGKPSEA